jgi:hypothetical protein
MLLGTDLRDDRDGAKKTAKASGGDQDAGSCFWRVPKAVRSNLTCVLRNQLLFQGTNSLVGCGEVRY